MKKKPIMKCFLEKVYLTILIWSAIVKWYKKPDACYRGTRICNGVWLEKAKGVTESKGKNGKFIVVY